MTVAVVCEHCGDPLPPPSGKGGPRRKYCPDTVKNCRSLAFQKRKREAKRAANPPKYNNPLNQTRTSRANSKDGRASVRRGPMYDAFKILGPEWSDLTWLELLEKRQVTVGEVVENTDESQANISRWYAAHIEDRVVEAKRAHWQPSAEAAAALEDFEAFDRRYFETAPGQPYHMKAFHRRWVGLLLNAYLTGSQVAIVTAPRQGKSELLIRFIIWLIVRDPNIRIIWVSKSQGLAEKMVGMVRRHLESNERLIEDFCGPGGAFRPPHRGGKWTDEEFVVDTRTIVQKAPTVIALGKGGTVVGNDADFIVGDDIEDDGTTASEKGREDTIRWWSKDLRSRKKAHTGWAYIGSRQHPEDLINWLINNPRWDTDITPVHDPGCVKPWDVPEAVEAEWPMGLSVVEVEDRRREWLDREHWDCVIFPEEFPFSYLKDTRESTQNDAIFEMQWLANPRPDGITHFEREIVEECREHRMPLGVVPDGCRLIAGVDPAPKRMQAAILWAVDCNPESDKFGHRWVVDVENQQAGGIVHMRSLLQRWSEQYPSLKDWVIEENIVSDALRYDEPIQQIRDRFTLNFIPHQTTGSTKWDPDMGVTAMPALFRAKKVHLPYADDRARHLVGQYIHQLINWDPKQGHGRNKAWKSDLVMAGWFPERTIQGWLREFDSVIRVGYRSSRSPWSTGFKGEVQLSGGIVRTGGLRKVA